MKIGRKLFYDKVTGVQIVDTGQWDNAIRNKTVDEEIASYPALSERNRETFDVLELPFGAYAQDFAECDLVGVDTIARKPIFALRTEEGQPPVILDKPFSVQIAELQQSNDLLGKQMVETEMDMMTMEAINNFLGGQLVAKDFEVFALQDDSNTLGTQLVDVDIRLMMGGL